MTTPHEGHPTKSSVALRYFAGAPASDTHGGSA
jgi:hypothetical protein